jgi:ElaB/YqjD/DUF883 family membrane-anchored ribosome-binding protein
MENTNTIQSRNPGNEHGKHEQVERVAAGAHKTLDKVADATHSAADKIADATHHAADAISEKGAQLQDLQEEWLENVRKYINENPVKSVGIAIAGGFLLSRLLSGR